MIIDLAKDIKEIKVPDGCISVTWLGQSGFIFKTSGGKIILLDAYLSEYCERTINFKRITPNILDIDKIGIDYIITSHDHPDHFDYDAIPLIMEKNTECILIGPESCINHCKEIGLDSKRYLLICKGEMIDLGDFKIKGVFCNHGELAKDALGFIFSFNDIKVYFAGDTAFTPKEMDPVVAEKPRLAILPINGAYGNLDPVEAAFYAKIVKSKITVPCHFWTFVEHDLGCPGKFLEAMNKFSPECGVKILKYGESFTL
jgi:L-ascorbate 6-phosphate lactonase